MSRIASPPRSPWLIAMWCLVAVGVLIRIVRYAADRSLWGDEGAVALNILERSPRELLHPLDYMQGAPTGFLLAEKAATSLFGDRELVLRLFPLLCGIAALVVFALIARRLLRIEAAVLAVALAAFSDPLVYYSSEVKQYETDVLAGLVLLYGAIAVNWGRVSIPSAIGLAVGGSAVVWFSHPALLVLPSLLIVLLVSAWLRKERRALSVLVSLGAVWAASALIAYVVNHQNTRAVANAALGSTGSTGRGFKEPLKNAWHAYSEVVGVANTATALAVVVAVIGLLVLARRTPTVAGLLVAPGIAAFLAGLAGRYPFSDRFILFLAPGMILLAAAGAVELVVLLPRPLAPAAGILIAVLLIYPVAVSAKRTVNPPGHEEVKAVLRTVEKDWKPGDALYVWYQSQYPFRYYAECSDCHVLGPHGPASVVWPPDPRTIQEPYAAKNHYAIENHPPSLYVSQKVHDLADYVDGFKPLAGKKRAWFLFSSTWDDAFVQQTLDCMGKRLVEARSTRAVAYLYDLSTPSTSSGCVG